MHMMQWLKSKFRYLGFDIVKMNKKSLSNRDLYEHDLKAVITSSAPIIFDVGANKGQSIEVFMRLFPTSTIYSFEPNESLYKKLKEQYKNNANVHLYCAALGSKEEIKKFSIYKTTELSSFHEVSDNELNPFKDEQVDKIVSSEVWTFDHFLINKGISHIDLLKIDTQGYEMEVIFGATSALTKGLVQHLYLELNFIDLYKDQSNPLRIIEFLLDRGYGLVGLYDLNRPEKYIRWANGLFRLILQPDKRKLN